MRARRRALLGVATLPLADFALAAAGDDPAQRRVPREAGPVLVLIDVEVGDAARFGEYVRGHTPGLLAAGGRFLAASATLDVVEGDWSPRRVVVHEWPTAGAFYDWYDGESYRPWKALRHAAARTRVVLLPMLPRQG